MPKRKLNDAINVMAESQYNTRIDSDSSSEEDDDDAAPPRRPQTIVAQNVTSAQQERVDSDSDSDSDDAAPPRRSLAMKDGTKAGLVQLQEYQDTISRNQKKQEALDNEIFQNNQQMETIYRDKDGNQLTASEEFERRQLLEREQKAIQTKEKIVNNLGVVQMKESLLEQKKLEEIKKSTFSRYKNDKQLEQELKSLQRVEDPMAKFIHTTTTTTLPNNNTNEEIPNKMNNDNPNNIPLKQGLPNRFKIKPGYRWDGVDRGNGFEMRLLHSISKKKIDAERKYIYASRNM